VDNQIGALLHASYPGQNGGQALAEILFGTVNPSGKLPFTWEKLITDNPAFATFPMPLNQKPPNPTTISYSATVATKKMAKYRSFRLASDCPTRRLLTPISISNLLSKTTAKNTA
jgi:beta-glucosidase